MKVTVILGSPRKKDGFRLCRQLEEAMPQPCEFQYLHLKDHQIEECRGCDQCFLKSETLCPCRDELPHLKAALLDADGLVFAAPVYACHIPSGMKRFLDRLSYLFHRQELVGKPAAVVVTTAGGGDGPVAAYLKMTLSGWGCRLSGVLRVRSPLYFPGDHFGPDAYNERYHAAKQSELHKLAGRFHAAMASGTRPTPSFYELYLFQGLRSKTFASAADYDYWKERGWLDAAYFYPVRLGPVKALFSRMMQGVIDRLAFHR